MATKVLSILRNDLNSISPQQPPLRSFAMQFAAALLKQWRFSDLYCTWWSICQHSWLKLRRAPALLVLPAPSICTGDQQAAPLPVFALKCTGNGHLVKKKRSVLALSALLRQSSYLQGLHYHMGHLVQRSYSLLGPYGGRSPSMLSSTSSPALVG